MSLDVLLFNIGNKLEMTKQVNNFSLRGVTHDQAISALRRTPPKVLCLEIVTIVIVSKKTFKVRLLIYRDVNLQLSLLDPTQIYNIFEVELVKKPGRGLGLSIAEYCTPVQRCRTNSGFFGVSMLWTALSVFYKFQLKSCRLMAGGSGTYGSLTFYTTGLNWLLDRELSNEHMILINLIIRYL
ncbi:hypothetical protein DICVIV_09431 [Dictyocaulus viviparus]|uniref:Uncharacterized protein n=1 Tax=Dictyocaulus viviparus TaxID=29172 RepID=A0A0D8XL35_DICVI|nr:hypothetical protein DICVIV_09431 [Dictyocaulus viviparus]